jgi:hypothetical protein
LFFIIRLLVTIEFPTAKELIGRSGDQSRLLRVDIHTPHLLSGKEEKKEGKGEERKKRREKTEV